MKVKEEKWKKLSNKTKQGDGNKCLLTVTLSSSLVQTQELAKARTRIREKEAKICTKTNLKQVNMKTNDD